MTETESVVGRLLTDLENETESLVNVLAGMDQSAWATMTAAEPWTVADQIGHLAYFDEQAALAISDPTEFARITNQTADALAGDPAVLHRSRGLDGKDLLDWFVEARSNLKTAALGLDPDQRISWYGPPMRATSFVTARLMETWAHGTDVAEALGTSLEVSDRLFLIADLGVRTFSWSFANRGLDVPGERVRVALRGPSGATRVWNDAFEASITGPVEDFCLVVTQRRRVEDTHLVLEGTLAQRWMSVAQVFAGPPGPGR